MALQPCAMALGADHHDCPHCPPAETPPCDLITGPDCGLDTVVANEVPSSSFKLKDVPNDVPLAIMLATVEPARSRHGPKPAPYDCLLLNPSGPPRNVLFCVYLK